MWLFKHKYFADGSLSTYKARLVINGTSQQIDVDYDETFSPIVKTATIRTVLSFVASRHWLIHQLDVKNAFLHGTLSETVSTSSYATRIGFCHNICDSSLFINKQGSDVAYLLLYVDDILLPASSITFLERTIASLHQDFSVIDLGLMNYFLGIFVTRSTKGMFLCQEKSAAEILECVGIRNFHSCRTPVDTESKLGADGTPVFDPTLYRSIVGALQYLTFIRRDLSYEVQKMCLYMHDPWEPHLTALKRILRHVRGTLDYSL
ncbi:ribonuclease H-like domain-containing protein [Tanacetum coccineum]